MLRGEIQRDGSLEHRIQLLDVGQDSYQLVRLPLASSRPFNPLRWTTVADIISIASSKQLNCPHYYAGRVTGAQRVSVSVSLTRAVHSNRISTQDLTSLRRFAAH